MPKLSLEGIDGKSPLGFLAALGVLVALDQKWPSQVKLGWLKGYCPVVEYPGDNQADHKDTNALQSEIASAISAVLGVPKIISEDASEKVDDLFIEFSMARKVYNDRVKQLKKKEKDLCKEGKSKGFKRDDVRVWVDERVKGERSEVGEAENALFDARKKWLAELGQIVPSPELRLGKTISITASEYRDAAQNTLSNSHGPAERRESDFLAAFASESVTDGGQVATTPFCFVTGSGHQYFLETVAKLMLQVDAAKIEKSLFYPWVFEDERLSLRWAPVEDRRYALMWGDPSGQEARSNWAANLLAYNSLRLLPVVDVGGRLAATAFSTFAGRKFFSWPIWEGLLHCDGVRSLLSLRAIQSPRPDRAQLGQMGVLEVFRCERLQVGTPPLVKLNFGTSFPAGTADET